MSEIHSKHSPSGLPNKETCAGWQSDPTPGPMAIRGTAIHGLIAGKIRGHTTAGSAEHMAVANVGMELFAALKQRFPDHRWEAEVKLDTGIPDVYGTGDVVGVSEWSPVGVIVDWKTSRGQRDDAGTSLQTAAYALGLLRAHPHLQEIFVMMGELEQTPTEAMWTRADLETTEKRIRLVVAKCEKFAEDPAHYNPQPKACQYCARRTHCPALARSVAETAATLPAVESVRSLSPMELSAALKRYLPAAKLVEQFVGALEDRAKEMLAADPAAVPGFMIKESNGARGWTAPDDVVRSEITGQFPGLSVDAIASPTEVEKRIAERLGTKGAKKAAADAIKGLCKATARKSLVEA